MVLLKNDARALPLDPAAVSRITVAGRLADAANTGDQGSSNVRAPYTVTPLEGLRTAFGDDAVDYVEGCDPAEAARRARHADAAIVVVGYTANDEGEYLKSVVSPDMLPLLPEPVTAEQCAAKQACQAYMKEGVSTFGGNAEGGDRASLHLNPEDVELIHAVPQPIRARSS